MLGNDEEIESQIPASCDSFTVFAKSGGKGAPKKLFAYKFEECADTPEISEIETLLASDNSVAAKLEAIGIIPSKVSQGLLFTFNAVLRFSPGDHKVELELDVLAPCTTVETSAEERFMERLTMASDKFHQQGMATLSSIHTAAMETLKTVTASANTSSAKASESIAKVSESVAQMQATVHHTIESNTKLTQQVFSRLQSLELENSSLRSKIQNNATNQATISLMGKVADAALPLIVPQATQIIANLHKTVNDFITPQAK